MVNKLGKPTEKEQEQSNCSVLFDEVKGRIQILRDSGISESRIASLFYCERPLLSLTISKNYRIFLGDNRIEVHMEPLVKAVYLLFLSHPEGIAFKCLPDYRKELADIYQKIKPLGLTERAIRSIEDVTNPLLNSINEKCSRIRAMFQTEVDASLLDQYIITGKSGEAKKISLPRDLVVWE